MAQYANAVLTKARAMYGRMLSPAQYDELLRRQSVQEISAYLKDKTSYASALAGVQDSTIHRGQLENLLHKDTFYHYARLVHYVHAEGTAYRYIISDMEIELILACLRSMISGHANDFIAEIPAFIRPYAGFDVFSLAQATTPAALAQLLSHTVYGATLARCAQEGGTLPINYTAYEVALRTLYFDTLLEYAQSVASGKAAEDLRRLIFTRAEMMNVNNIYRLKTYFNAPPEQIRRSLLPVRGLISRRELDALVDAKDAQTFMQLLSKTSYGRHILPDATFIESQTDRIRFGLYRKELHFSTDPQVVFMAFMLLRGMETENIIRIIEGVRYKLPPERIERLLSRG